MSPEALLEVPFLNFWYFTVFVATVSILNLWIRQRQRDNWIELQGEDKNLKNVKVSVSRWSTVAATNILIMQWPTTLWPENMVKLFRQCCCVPSSGSMVIHPRADRIKLHLLSGTGVSTLLKLCFKIFVKFVISLVF